MRRLQQRPPKRRQTKIRVHRSLNPRQSCRLKHKINLILLRGKAHLSRPRKLPRLKTPPNNSGSIALAGHKNLQQPHEKVGQFRQRASAASSSGENRRVRVVLTNHKAKQEATRGNLLLPMLLPQISQQVTRGIQRPRRIGRQQPGGDHEQGPKKT